MPSALPRHGVNSLITVVCSPVSLTYTLRLGAPILSCPALVQCLALQLPSTPCNSISFHSRWNGYEIRQETCLEQCQPQSEHYRNVSYHGAWELSCLLFFIFHSFIYSLVPGMFIEYLTQISLYGRCCGVKNHHNKRHPCRLCPPGASWAEGLVCVTGTSLCQCPVERAAWRVRELLRAERGRDRWARDGWESMKSSL